MLERAVPLLPPRDAWVQGTFPPHEREFFHLSSYKE